MIQPIMKDEQFLSIPSKKATRKDIQVGQDLLDTLHAHAHECVGMATNMIGVSKCIIVVHTPIQDLVMYNPVIVSQKGKYETEEGCLSLIGQRKTTRYETITVEYQDARFKRQKKTFSDFTAQIIQHEIDHTKGIVI